MPDSNPSKSVVRQLLATTFAVALSQHPELHQKWIDISFRIGSLLPNSLLMMSIQDIGKIDMLLRSVEKEFTPGQKDKSEITMLAFHCQKMFSGFWIGSMYEIFRLLADREIVPDSPEFQKLAHELRLLRIPIEKHEIAADRKLNEPLVMQKQPAKNDGSDQFIYDKNDKRRAHIMSSGVSHRGSCMWQVTDVSSLQSFWLERLDLSDRIIALWGSDTQPT